MSSPLTPVCQPGRAVIYVIAPSSGDPEILRATLSRDERERALRFRFPHDSLAWINWRAGLRRILGEQLGIPPVDIPLQVDECGKPHLTPPYHGLHFNLSHSQNLAVVILCQDGPVGIDLESLDRASSLLECSQEFCHPAEMAELPRLPKPRAEALLNLWVAKEATLKALRCGFGFAPQNLRITGRHATSDLPLPGLELLKIETPSGPPAHQLAAAVPIKTETLVCHYDFPPGPDLLD